MAYRYACVRHFAAIEGRLITEYGDWLIANGLPSEDAQNVIHMELTDDQRSWLTAFVQRWEACMAGAHLAWSAEEAQTRVPTKVWHAGYEAACLVAANHEAEFWRVLHKYWGNDAEHHS